MARVDWNSYQERVAEQEARQGSFNSDGPKIGFFSLKNDKDEAVVRFVYDNPSQFELIAAHTIRDANGRWRSVSCLRNPKDPMDMCPLCANGDKVGLKFYIKLIHYERQEDGTIVGTPKVWERSASYAQKLASKMNEYGPLTECLFKVRRNGAAGSMKTEYDIDYAPEMRYPSSAYTKDGIEAFEGFSALGRMVAEKSYEDMMALTGNSAHAAPVAPVAAPVVAPVTVNNNAVDGAAPRTYRTPTQPVAGVGVGSEDTAARPKRNNYW